MNFATVGRGPVALTESSSFRACPRHAQVPCQALVHQTQSTLGICTQSSQSDGEGMGGRDMFRNHSYLAHRVILILIVDP